MNIRRLTLLALSVLAVILFTGCIQMHSETIIDKNGGGTATMTMSVSKTVSDAMKQMSELDPDSDTSDMPDIDSMDRKEIEKRLKGFDVKLTKFEKKDVDGKQTVVMAYEFKDLKGLSAAMGSFMGGGDSEENGLGVFDAGNGNLVLRPAHYDLPAFDEEEAADVVDEAPAMDEMDPAAMQKQMALMGTLMSAAAELDISMKITVPGDIVSTNAPAQEGRTSIWTINSGNMMMAGDNMAPEIVFSGNGVKIKPMAE